MPHEEDRSSERDTVLGTILGLLGKGATLELVEKAGGARLYVPEAPAPESRIAKLVGLPAAQALSKEFAGIAVNIPLAKLWRVSVYRERGMSYADIAIKLCTSETNVHRWLRTLGLTKTREQDGAAGP
jgi:hypothetical protein